MAVAYVAPDYELPNQDTVGSIAFTSVAVGATSNPVIVVAVALENNGTVSVGSVVASAGLTCANAGNGANNGILIKAQNETGVGGARVEIWALVAPAGTGTITVTLTGGTSDVQGHATLYSGASQTTPCPPGDAESVNTTATNPLTLSMAAVGANDLSYGMGANYLGGDAPVFQSPGTELFNNNGGNVNAAAGYRVGAGSISVLWGTVDHTVLVGVRVAAASAAGTTLTPGAGSVPFASAPARLDIRASNQILIGPA